jgi:hypothetical protein
LEVAKFETAFIFGSDRSSWASVPTFSERFPSQIIVAIPATMSNNTAQERLNHGRFEDKLLTPFSVSATVARRKGG